MRVLVTGLDGFTGRYVEAELKARGDEVVAFAADLTDSNQVDAALAQTEFDALIHLAAISFVGHDNPRAFYDVNVTGSFNLLSALANRPRQLRHVVMASSAAVYGNQPTSVLDESLAPRPANDYGVSKLAMEHLALLRRDSLPITIVRPFNYTGVGQESHFVVPKIVAHFRERRPTIELGNLDVYREFGDVRSVAATYCELLDAPATGTVVNVCTGKVNSLREVIDTCSAQTDHQIDVQVNPAFVRPDEIKTLRGNTARLEALLGARAAPDLADTLAWMLESPIPDNGATQAPR